MEEKKRKHPMETNGKNLIGTPRTCDATHFIKASKHRERRGEWRGWRMTPTSYLLLLYKYFINVYADTRIEQMTS